VKRSKVVTIDCSGRPEAESETDLTMWAGAKRRPSVHLLPVYLV
jgi:hypothetical protein